MDLLLGVENADFVRAIGPDLAGSQSAGPHRFVKPSSDSSPWASPRSGKTLWKAESI